MWLIFSRNIKAPKRKLIGAKNTGPVHFIYSESLFRLRISVNASGATLVDTWKEYIDFNCTIYTKYQFHNQC